MTLNPFSNDIGTVLFFKMRKNQSPKYLFELIPTARQAYMTRHKNSIPLFNIKHDYFKKCFFHSTIIECSILDSNIRNSESLAIFKKHILDFIRWCKWYLSLSQPSRFKANYKAKARFKSPYISQI